MFFYVNTGVANIYKHPEFRSEVVSQAVLWEQLRYSERENHFMRVVTEDGYSGWISKFQMAESVQNPDFKFKMITAPQVYFYAKPEENNDIIRDATCGVMVPVLAENDQWFQSCFPDGLVGWSKKSAYKNVPLNKRSDLVKTATSFMGLPYIWGGKTPKGFDCSGYTQLVHKLSGFNLRRDAWMQFKDARLVSSDPLSGEPGDLYFFSEKDDQISHVGICIAPGKVIHARGMVRINSLNANDKLFDRALLSTFREIRTYFD